MSTLPSGAIHFGGSISAKGNLTSYPRGRKTFSDLANIEKLVRLDIAIAKSGIGMPNQDIARMVGRSHRTLEVWRRKPEYLRMRTQIMYGIALDDEQSA